MDVVLEEEKRALSNIETKLALQLKECNDEQSERSIEKNAWRSVDYDDIQDRATANKRYNSNLERIAEISESMDCPYFARIDVEPLNPNDDSNMDTYYIGKKMIWYNTEVLVIDWRSEMAGCYASQSETSFEVKGHQYNLHLRRALEIAKAHVLRYETLFERIHYQKKDELIVDPFLKKTLEKRRQEHQITDIIQTIQNNQNNIIREERNTNFIVQGCAGSGKTMILLHRLSYLKYHNPDLFQSGVTIITPNKAFKQSIHDLSDQLELTTVDQKTIEEYYVALIKRFSSKLNVRSTVASENELPLPLRRVLYSTRYSEQLIAQYHVYWENILQQLDALELYSLAQKFDLPYPCQQNHNKSNYEELLWWVSKINNAIKQNPIDIKNAQVWIKENTDKLNEIPRKIKNVRDILSNLNKDQKSAKKSAEKELQRLTVQMPKLKMAIEAQKNKLNLLLAQSVSDAEKRNANTARFLVKKLSLKNISEAVMVKSLLDLHQTYQHPYLQKNYRYKLYFKLLFCSLYYVTATKYDRFLNIDEAQDLAFCEYKLLKNILGDRCVFNLYGDVNQLLHSYKGINNWQDVLSLFSANIYTLNENYRNSNEITQYCNDEFDYQIQSIGDDVSEIQQCPLFEAVNWCINKKRKMPDYRIAIIIKAANTSVPKLLKAPITPWNRSWLKVDLECISILTVEQSKGLEFDAVVVLNYDMTPNERYVAYTRAISELIITTDSVSTNESRKKINKVISVTSADFDVLDDE